MTAAGLYAAVCEYLLASGWRRDPDFGNRWRFPTGNPAMTRDTGAAFELQLGRDGISSCKEPA